MTALAIRVTFHADKKVHEWFVRLPGDDTPAAKGFRADLVEAVTDANKALRELAVVDHD